MKSNGWLELLFHPSKDDQIAPGEKNVLKALPEAIIPYDIDDEAYCNLKNRVVLGPE